MKLSPDKQKKLAIAVVVVIAVVAGLYWFLVKGLKAKQEDYKKQLADLNDKCTKKNNSIKLELSNRSAAKEYEVYLAKYEVKMPAKGTNPETDILRLLTEMAARHKLTINNTSLEKMPELSNFKFKELPYSLVGFKLDFKGEFDQIGKFIQDIENSNPLMEVDQLSIVSGNDSLLGAHVHTVSMRVSMVIQS